jgi:glycylpeptide N-tetradecanoyltransferase
MPQGSTELRQKYKYKLESHPNIKGLRPMKSEDIPAVMELLVKYLDRFHLRQEWTQEEIAHWLCSDATTGVVWSYVVEDSEKGRITDFVSYYLLEVRAATISHSLNFAILTICVVYRPPLKQPPRKHPRCLSLLLRH